MSPSCCIVYMLGVGAVCEWPKKGRRVGDCDDFQWWSAEVSMPRGHGGVVAHFSMVEALGRSEQKVFWGGCWVVVRKAWSIGPKRHQGSMVKGMRTILLRMRSPMMSSPLMNGVVADAGLLGRRSFLRS